MLIKVIGAGAGGGLPQWNCNGRNSADARKGVPTVSPRSQASVAVSADGRQWVLLNAAPDLRQQINATPELQPNPDGPPRNSPIKAVVLTNGDVDAVAGLLCLREGQPFTVYGSDRVLDVLAGNSIFDVLNPDLVKRVPMALGKAFPVVGPEGPVGLTVEAFTVPGKIPLYLEDEEKGTGGSFGTEEGDTVGLKVTEDSSGEHFFFIPGCSRVDDVLRARLSGAPLLFFDGTLYTNEEMIEQGLMSKTGDRIGHMNMSGPEGTLAQLAPLNIARKIFIHINNSNPVLRDDSPERAAVEAAGWEVSYDGMVVTS
ncbi:pyrroloquinoline quinone biosynthesis protein B [Methyloceanibacter superfactus]|jgi:pyrroloquinoline quinone biosynthesis protein B|uniref:Coenzyme PQQ synthesis protein B n=1 Tax=Methyloceanibacter superfactus TaxID=1774969 RepID=A0A1E3VXB1_9HYPH|nr:pyrroloquinoline quinone biosynthesis protein PqqB [Methyloceanibacter superfactus]ODR98163.1 pyrroloquinoline quinone biosynthesis protein B [Methyloceanibacter superfactus]